MKRTFLKRPKTPLKASKRPSKPRKPKKPTPARLKRSLDIIFSKYIRAKYPKKCFTCGVEGKTLQCGHFVSRTYLATRWEEDNCRPQCIGCNIYGAGKPLDFEDNLKLELGVRRVEEIKQSRKFMWKLKPEWYEEKIQEFTNKLKLCTNE